MKQDCNICTHEKVCEFKETVKEMNRMLEEVYPTVNNSENFTLSVTCNNYHLVVCGKWISTHINGDRIGCGVVCNVCDGWQDYETRYCPSCGAKMEVER